MIIKVDWFPRPTLKGTLPPRLAHIYEADDYFTEWSWSEENTVNSEGRRWPNLRLMINRGQIAHDLILSGGDTAYVMNDSGKTIEILRTQENTQG